MQLTTCLNWKLSSILWKKILNVAEKRDAAQNIARFLAADSNLFGDKSKHKNVYQFNCKIDGKFVDMVMTSVSGHLMSFEFPCHLKNWRTVDPKILLESPIERVCIKTMKSIKGTLEKLIMDCHMLIIWTDCDREGENIGVEIVNVCLAVNPNIIVKRAKFSEITKQSVNRAINNLVDINMKLSQAVDVRQELDLKSGAVFTRLQTLCLRKKFPQQLSERVISYGSCQFPTLGFVVERYKEVESFVPEPFWKIVLNHEKNQECVEFNWDRIRLFDEKLVLDIKNNITNGGSQACVIDISKNPKSKRRPFAMDTIEMQKLASRKLKINPKITMDIAEKLYCTGFISYPRTETTIFPKEIDLVKLVATQTCDKRWEDFAKKILKHGIVPCNGKKFDNAHPPIHPLKSGDSLMGNEARLFELITRHFLACVSKDAVGHETKIFLDCISQSHKFINWSLIDNKFERSGLGEGFNLSGLSVLEKNYLEIYPYDIWSEKEIPIYELGEIFTPTSVTIHKGSTSPPQLLTDADLIALMDKHGIGTDATYAEHIDKVKKRNYVFTIDSNSSYLIPGKLGMGLIKGYDMMEVNLSKPNLRSNFEADLVHICQGTKQPKDVLNFHLEEYKSLFQKTTAQIKKLEEGVGIYLNENENSLTAMPTQFSHVKKSKASDKTGKTNVIKDETDNNGNSLHSPSNCSSINKTILKESDKSDEASTDVVLQENKIISENLEFKKGQVRHCSVCGNSGHNAKTCPSNKKI